MSLYFSLADECPFMAEERPPSVLQKQCPFFDKPCNTSMYDLSEPEVPPGSEVS